MLAVFLSLEIKRGLKSRSFEDGEDLAETATAGTS